MRILIGLLVILVFYVWTTPYGWSQCSLATLKGRYAYIEQGTTVPYSANVPSGPYLTTGAATFDGIGNWSGTRRSVIQGKLQEPDPMSGTYEVSPDCTWSTEIRVRDMIFRMAGAIIGRGVSQEAQMAYSEAVGEQGSFVSLVRLKKAPPGACSQATLKGRYALFGQGTRAVKIGGDSCWQWTGWGWVWVCGYAYPGNSISDPPSIPVSHNGVVTFNGEGGFAVQEISSVNGTITTSTYRGTYSVEADNCTLAATVSSRDASLFPDGTVLVGTITGEGAFREVHAIVAAEGWTFTETFRKQ